MNKFILALFILLSINTLASTKFSNGEIFFVAVNSNDIKSFAFTTTTDIQTNTQIYFTDNAWIDSTQTLKNTEDIITFTAQKDIEAGEIIYSDIKSDKYSFDDTLNLSKSGETILAFQIDNTDTIFISGIGWGKSNNWEFNSKYSSNTSDIPNFGKEPINVVQLGTKHNYKLNVNIEFTNTEDLFKILQDKSNYEESNDITFNQFNNIFSFAPNYSSTQNECTNTIELITDKVCKGSQFADLEFTEENFVLYTDNNLTTEINLDGFINNDTIIYMIDSKSDCRQSKEIAIQTFEKEDFTYETNFITNTEITISCTSNNTVYWYDQDNNMISSENQFIAQTGNYYYAKYIDGNNCLYQTDLFQIFPQTSKIEKIDTNTDYEIFDLNGKTICKSCKTEILSKGLYILKDKNRTQTFLK